MKISIKIVGFKFSRTKFYSEAENVVNYGRLFLTDMEKDDDGNLWKDNILQMNERVR